MKNNPKQPKFIALSIDSEMRASHSLEGFEVPHFHLWKIKVEFQASLPLPGDRLIDLVFLQSLMEQILAPIRGTHLNEKLAISPTSENLALWLWDELSSVLPDAPMHSITVDLCNLDGDSMGSARVFA